MTVRIGFIGTGAIATDHLTRLLRIPQAEVVALSDLSLDRVEAARSRVNERAAQANLDRRLDAVAYDDYNAMIRNEKLDAVFVCVPQFARGETEAAVIDAGLHMLVEKPLGLNLEGPDTMLQKIDSSESIVSVGYLLRYLDTIQRMKELVAERTVGMAVVMRFGRTPNITWYPYRNKSGGQLVDMVTHQIDLLRYTIGEIDTVYAAAALRINNKNNPEYDIFDVTCLTLTFENGAVANVAHNMISGHGVPAGARGMHIFCEDMTLSKGGGSRDPLEILTKDGKQEVPEGKDPMLAQAEAFVQAVATGDRSLILSDYLSGLRTLAVTLAGEQSAQTNTPVKVMDLIREHAPYAYKQIEAQG